MLSLRLRWPSLLLSLGLFAIIAAGTLSVLWTRDGGHLLPALVVPANLCGNGTTEYHAGENCDDGNKFDEDGCSGHCTLEPGWSCHWVEMYQSYICTINDVPGERSADSIPVHIYVPGEYRVYASWTPNADLSDQVKINITGSQQQWIVNQQQPPNDSWAHSDENRDGWQYLGTSQISTARDVTVSFSEDEPIAITAVKFIPVCNAPPCDACPRPDGTIMYVARFQSCPFRASSSSADPLPPPPPCTDSDGGRVYDRQGRITNVVFNSTSGPVLPEYVDSCAFDDPMSLVEGYCGSYGYGYMEKYTCPYGCRDGACLAQQSSSRSSSNSSRSSSRSSSSSSVSSRSSSSPSHRDCPGPNGTIISIPVTQPCPTFSSSASSSAAQTGVVTHGNGPDGTGPIIFPAIEALGEALTPLGTVDRDSMPDIAVGAPGNLYKAPFVYILHLRSDGGAKSYDAIPYPREAGETTTKFGSAIVNVGDLDWNGVPDIAVGAFGVETGTDNQKFDGEVWVFLLEWGNDGEINVKSRYSLASPVPSTSGPGIYFGASLASLGNGKLAIASKKGVWIASLGPSGMTLAQNPLIPWNNTLSVIASVGDLDKDGAPDLIEQAAAYPAKIHYLNTTATAVMASETLNIQSAIPVIEQSAPIIVSLASLGDINEDGLPELGAGVQVFSQNIWHPGMLYQEARKIYLSGCARSHSVMRTESIDDTAHITGYFGSAIASVGDLNGDEVSDFAVGASWTQQTGGSRTGSVQLFMQQKETAAPATCLSSSSSSFAQRISSASSSLTRTNCGNGMVDAPVENCDDGNAVSGDGCSNICRFECTDTDPTDDPGIRGMVRSFYCSTGIPSCGEVVQQDSCIPDKPNQFVQYSCSGRAPYYGAISAFSQICPGSQVCQDGMCGYGAGQSSSVLSVPACSCASGYDSCVACFETIIGADAEGRCSFLCGSSSSSIATQNLNLGTISIRAIVVNIDEGSQVFSQSKLIEADQALQKLHAFVKESSYGKAQLHWSVSGVFELGSGVCNHSSYGENSRDLIQRALQAADNEKPLSDYSYFLIVHPYITCPDGQTWSFEGYGQFTDFVLNGKTVRVRGIRLSDLSDAYLFHEFGHTLAYVPNTGIGHPDYLNCPITLDGDETVIALSNTCPHVYDYNAGITPVFTLMSSPTSLSDFSAAEKEMAGWLSNSDIITTSSGQYSLSPIEQTGSAPKALKIPLPETTRSIYVSFRQPIGSTYPATVQNKPNGVIMEIVEFVNESFLVTNTTDRNAPLKIGVPYRVGTNGPIITVKSISNNLATILVSATSASSCGNGVLEVGEMCEIGYSCPTIRCLVAPCPQSRCNDSCSCVACPVPTPPACPGGVLFPQLGRDANGCERPPVCCAGAASGGQCTTNMSCTNGACVVESCTCAQQCPALSPSACPGGVLFPQLGRDANGCERPPVCCAGAASGGQCTTNMSCTNGACVVESCTCQ